MQGNLSRGSLPSILREAGLRRLNGRLIFTQGTRREGLHLLQGQVVGVETDTPAPTREDQARQVVQQVGSWTEGRFAFENGDGAGPASSPLQLPFGELLLLAARAVDDPRAIGEALGDLSRILVPAPATLARFASTALTAMDGYVLSRIDGTLSANEVIQLIPADALDVQKSLFGLLSAGLIEFKPAAAKPQPATAGSRATPPAASSTSSTVTPPRPAPGPAAPARAEATPKAAPLTADELRREIVRAHEDLAKRNHFEALGLTPAASEAEIKEAYFRLARRFHPDGSRFPELADLSEKRQAVFIRLGEAYEVLRDPAKRATYLKKLGLREPQPASPAQTATPETPPEPPDPAIEASQLQESYRRALKLFEAEKYWDAIQVLEDCLNRANDSLKQRVRVLLAKAYLKNPNWTRQAEEQLQLTVREDPRNVEAWFLLASIYQNAGLKSRAVSSLKRVLEQKPDHPEAQEALSKLDEAAAPETAPANPGLIKKIFGS